MKFQLHYTFEIARELHINIKARRKYQMDSSLFSLHGSLMLADFAAAKAMAYQLQRQGKAVSAADLYALGLLDELMHLLIAEYVADGDFFVDALQVLETQLGAASLEQLLLTFVKEFPPSSVYQGQHSAEAYLALPQHKAVVLEEMLLLKLENENPALRPFAELIDASALTKQPVYQQLWHHFERYADGKTQPVQGRPLSLLSLLRAPYQAAPPSLQAQLEYLRSHYGHYLADSLEDVNPRLLQGFDFLQEAQRPHAQPAVPAAAPPMHVPSQADLLGLSYGGFSERSQSQPVEVVQVEEYEGFSYDDAWMPEVVMLAKSSYVWLEQLSRRYQRHIQYLSDIPDAVLDEIAERGFSALWLIGLWQRSHASREIKQRMGQGDVLASAYALYDYQIAEELGGEAAYQDLQARALARGIRLASDMVPNHMGMDSRWLIEHPDWFVSLPEPPFPQYRFLSENLSKDARVDIRLEDSYYDQSDAAVVFRRQDTATGESRYIYHGNDGTLYPWNDTAQLDFSKPEVREGIIQTILHVARKFPIIRFDAAMVLAKRHIQRLWFPPAGAGGAIPSRAEYGSMSTERFNQHIPQEFWREVVDRVAREVPNTLLLAEAFWMLEGYFVRTLGMHRVYNSAFMNMLMAEENGKYRAMMQEILRFEPQILGRYVNFMSNPDEEPATAQFGDGDKYFGVFMLMATLPGLPMVAHGQLEGYHEKYGMEYRQPRYDEQVNEGLLDRHKWESFPLLRRRRQFALADNFLLFNVYTDAGVVLEDVYAYSNVVEGRASLCLFHNRHAEVIGTLHDSLPYKTAQDPMMRRSIAQGLGLDEAQGDFVIFMDLVSHLYYLRPSQQLIHQGFRVHLQAYEHHAFVDFQQVQDDAEGHYRQLYQHLAGQGVPSIAKALGNLRYAEIQAAFAALLGALPQLEPAQYQQFQAKVNQQLDHPQAALNAQNLEPEPVAAQPKATATKLSWWQRLNPFYQHKPRERQALRLYEALATLPSRYQAVAHVLEIYVLVQDIAVAKLHLWGLGDAVEQKLGLEDTRLLELMLREGARISPKVSSQQEVQGLLEALLESPQVQHYLRVNTWQGVRYFHQESYQRLNQALCATGFLHYRQDFGTLHTMLEQRLQQSHCEVTKLLAKQKQPT